MRGRNLISVIVAIYNISEYLSRCIESICTQSLEDLEIILVDDGSTDGSSQICDDFANKDNRIRVVHKQNGGAASARNTGIRIATGQYVLIVDGDDYLTKTMLEKMYQTINKTNADICICDAFINTPSQSSNNVDSYSVLGSSEFMPRILSDSITSQTWNKLIKRKCLFGIEFPNSTVEDMGAMHLIFSNASHVVIMPQKLYVYMTDRENSVTNRNRFRPESSLDRGNVMEQRYRIACKDYPQVKSVVRTKMISFYVSGFVKALFLDDAENTLSCVGAKLKKYGSIGNRRDGIPIKTYLLLKLINKHHYQTLRLFGSIYFRFFGRG